MSYLSEFQIGSRCSRNHGASHVFEKNFLRFRLFLLLLRSSTQGQIENLLGVRHVENRGCPSSRSLRNAVGISRSRAGVQIRQEIGFTDHRRPVRHRRLNPRNLDVLAVLQCQLERAL